MSLTWDAATMATGVASIDEQHRLLIAKLNQLFEVMKRGQGGKVLEDLLAFVGDYARSHFAHEENCMHRMACPAAAANQAAHAAFLQTFASISKRMAVTGPTTALVLETQRELSGWLRGHIVRVDTQMRSCAQD
jgi:hemerythrin